MQKVKTAPKASRRIAQRGALPMLYVLFWSFTGAASAAYLGLVIANPDLLNAVSSPAAPASQSQLPDELIASPQARELRNRLAEAQSDIAKLRMELNEHKEAYAATEESNPEPAVAEPLTVAAVHEDRIPAEEQVQEVQKADSPEAVSENTEPSHPILGLSVPGVSVESPAAMLARHPIGGLSATPAAPPLSEVDIANAATESRSAEPSKIETGALPVPPAPAPGLRPKPKPVTVVAVAKPKPAAEQAAAQAKPAARPPQDVAFGPATVVPGPAAQEAPMAVRLASAPTLEALRLTWKAMRERHGDTLRGLSARYVKQKPSSSGAAGPYTLVAGPVAKATDVLEICAGLGGESLECALTTFEGRTL